MDPICQEMSGHPSISRYREEEYEIMVLKGGKNE